MDNWVLTEPKLLVNQKQGESDVGETEVKVRVTHILVSNYDAYCYTGEKKIAYPKTLGRNAIGLVTDTGDKCYGVKKGSRVYLNAVRPCGKCLACRSGNKADCSDLKIAGNDFDGFMRDFVVCDYSEVTVIPDSVDDLHALCIEDVALAENIFNRLNLPTGATVAIIGGGFFASIVSQIASYYKLVPIVIGVDKRNIERLKRSGVFFTFATDENLKANVYEATSGKGCDAAIYTSCSKIPPSVVYSVLSDGATVVLSGFCNLSYSIDAGPLFEKKLEIFAMSDGYGYTESAINMLVHGAIDLSYFEKETLTKFEPSSLLEERAEVASYTAKMTVLKLIF